MDIYYLAIYQISAQCVLPFRKYEKGVYCAVRTRARVEYATPTTCGKLLTYEALAIQ